MAWPRHPSSCSMLPRSSRSRRRRVHHADIRTSAASAPTSACSSTAGRRPPSAAWTSWSRPYPRLDGVHVAFVVAHPPSRYVEGLVARAAELGVADRVHLLPYVPHDQVVSFLASADAGVIPIHHWPNHEVALITKFFEYAHARLPMIISDVRAMARGDSVSRPGRGVPRRRCRGLRAGCQDRAGRSGALPVGVRPPGRAGELDLGDPGQGARRGLPAAAAGSSDRSRTELPYRRRPT